MQDTAIIVGKGEINMEIKKMEENKPDNYSIFADAIIREYADIICDDRCLRKLTDDELKYLEEKLEDDITIDCSTPEQAAKEIASGMLQNTIARYIDIVMLGRVKYYTYRVTYKTCMDVVIKAGSEEDAKRYLNEMNDRELERYAGNGPFSRFNTYFPEYAELTSVVEADDDVFAVYEDATADECFM